MLRIEKGYASKIERRLCADTSVDAETQSFFLLVI